MIKISFLFILIFLQSGLLGQGSVMLVGGGGEDYYDWSDTPYGWFVQAADSGIIINIDASSTSSWYPGYFTWLGADNGSHDLQIPNRTVANDSSTYYDLISARGIFIEGGDQWPYVNYWKGTLVEDAIHHVFQQGGAIGGTSAGLAVLGEFVFDAELGGLAPDDAAYNPYHHRVSITDDFLQILPDVFTDSHFHTRARMGRLVPMLARRIQDHGNDNIIGIGVDDNTAFCIDANGQGTTYGEGTVTILYKSPNSEISVSPNTPVTFTHITYNQLNHSSVYNISTRQLVNPGSHLQPVGVPPSPATYQDTTLNGSVEATAYVGEVVITNLLSNPLNAWRGNLGQTAGGGTLPQTIIIPRLWNNLDYSENRFVAGMYGVATHPHYAAIYLDDNSSQSVSDQGEIAVDRLLYVLDGYNMTHAGFRNAATSNYPGIINATLHFLGDGSTYNLGNHLPIVTIDVPGTHPSSNKFQLYANYPNPFNPVTFFEFHLPESQLIRLEIYNMLGQMVEQLVNQMMTAGAHKIRWNASDYSSGVYYYKLSGESDTLTGKCLLLK
jgi:cyanophycinase